MRILKKRSLWFAMAVTGLFLWLFLRGTDFGEMNRALREANYVFLIPAILVYFVGVWFRAMRWRMLLKPIGATTTNSLFPVLVIGFMINNVLPGRLGMVARAYLAGEKGNLNKFSSAATIVMEGILDGLALLFILAAVAFFVPWNRWAEVLALSMALFFVLAFLFMAFLVFGEERRHSVFRPFRTHLPERWGRKLGGWLEFFIGGLAIMRTPGKLVPIFAVSLLVWLSETSTYYFVGHAFDLDLSYQSLLVVAAFASMTWILFFVTPGGVGAFDYVGKETLKLFAVSGTLAATYMTVLHVVLLLPVIVLGFIFLWWEHFTLTQVTRRAENKPEGQEPKADGGIQEGL